MRLVLLMRRGRGSDLQHPRDHELMKTVECVDVCVIDTFVRAEVEIVELASEAWTGRDSVAKSILRIKIDEPVNIGGDRLRYRRIEGHNQVDRNSLGMKAV